MATKKKATKRRKISKGPTPTEHLARVLQQLLDEQGRQNMQTNASLREIVAERTNDRIESVIGKVKLELVKFVDDKFKDGVRGHLDGLRDRLDDLESKWESADKEDDRNHKQITGVSTRVDSLQSMVSMIEGVASDLLEASKMTAKHVDQMNAAAAGDIGGLRLQLEQLDRRMRKVESAVDALVRATELTCVHGTSVNMDCADCPGEVDPAVLAQIEEQHNAPSGVDIDGPPATQPDEHPLEPSTIEPPAVDDDIPI